MRVALLALLVATPAFAQSYPGAAPATQTVVPGAIFGTNAIQGCGPVTGVLGSAGASVTLTCADAAGYVIAMTPTAGQPALIGTVASTDSVTGGNRLIFKTGVGELDVSSVPMTGAQTSVEYRTIGGGAGQTVSLTSYTSGSATVTIYGSYNPVAVFPNAPVHTGEEAALRAGRAYSASTGVQAVTVGQYLSMVLANPASTGQRAIITNRIVGCNNPTGQVPGQYYTLSNPVVNVPATAVTISNRKTGGASSILTSAYTASSAAFPDTSPTTPLATRIGGFVPTGGMEGGPGMAERTLEPGQSTAFSVLGVANGLGTTPSCIINLTWYEESVN